MTVFCLSTSVCDSNRLEVEEQKTRPAFDAFFDDLNRFGALQSTRIQYELTLQHSNI
jgi:hypothetical protein